MEKLPIDKPLPYIPVRDCWMVVANLSGDKGSIKFLDIHYEDSVIILYI